MVNDVVKFVVFAGGDGDCEGGGVDVKAMAFEGAGGGDGFGDGEDDANGDEVGDQVVVLVCGLGKVEMEGKDPVVSVIVDERGGVEVGASGVEAQLCGDVAGDELENAGGLGLAKKAGGEAV